MEERRGITIEADLGLNCCELWVYVTLPDGTELSGAYISGTISIEENAPLDNNLWKYITPEEAEEMLYTNNYTWKY